MLISLLFAGKAYAQLLGTKGVNPVEGSSAVSGKKYAIVVGISDYQNPSIPDLKYADRDASIFAEYLADPNGGGLEKHNIKLLLNEHATAGNVIMAMYGMLEDTKEGDLLIFYFSGHGDLETKTINQPGFLLCWDAPPSVYFSGGTFGLVYLQEIVSSLSINNKANVLMITDACRAGKLAGSSIGGSQLTSMNLSKQFANEMKLLSCQPNELSLEGQKWGGGRGVFSYYLIRGLKGLADRNSDLKVSLSEIERYLEDEISQAVSPQHQLPMAIGNKSSLIAQVHPPSKQKLLEEKTQTGEELVTTASRGHILELSQSSNPKVKMYYEKFITALNENHLLYPDEFSAFEIYLQLKGLEISESALAELKHKLAAAFVDEVQQSINDYLKSDPVELRARWNYNKRYKYYPEYLDKAIELLGARDKMFNMLKARQHYYKGLNYRMEAELTKNSTLYDTAITEQFNCLKLEPNAGFAYNELGLTEKRRKNSDLALNYFKEAANLAPSWALPYANIGSIFLDTGITDSALVYSKKACLLDSTFALAQYNYGASAQAANLLEEAEQHYTKSIELDRKYSFAYFNLCLVYYFKNQFVEAKQMILKYLELEPADSDAWVNLGEIERKLNNPDEAKNSFQKALDINPDNYSAHNSFAEYYLNNNDLMKASLYLDKCVLLNPKDPVIYYFKAIIALRSGLMDDSVVYFEKAFSMGFSKIESLKIEVNYKNLKKNKRFKQLTKSYFPDFKL